VVVVVAGIDHHRQIAGSDAAGDIGRITGLAAELAQQVAGNQHRGHHADRLGDHGRAGGVEHHSPGPDGVQSTVEQAALEFLKKYSSKGNSPMCGNSIGQDRRFMARYMPTLEDFFHYRNLDVSTLKELCKRWQPEIYKGFKKKSKHTAMADIYESIDELKYYREHFLAKPQGGQ
jgi:oligoribonuclease (3'-5' exoribonuclease)